MHHHSLLSFFLILPSLLDYFLTYLSTCTFRIGRSVSRLEVTKSGFSFWGFIFRCSIFYYGCMFAFVVFLFL